MNTMTYKGYTAEVVYEAEDDVLVGYVKGIRDMISCEGQSIEELRNDFHGAIDLYLQVCQEEGLPPQIMSKPKSPAKTTHKKSAAPRVRKRRRHAPA